MGKNVFAGTGISKNEDSYKAGREAVEMAIKNAGKNPDFGIVFCSSKFDVNKLVKGAHEAFTHANPEVKWMGCTTAGEISNYGITEGSCVALAVQSDYIHVGIGISEEAIKNPRKAGITAATNALDDMKLDKYIDGYIQYIATKKRKAIELVKLRPYNFFILSPGTSLDTNVAGDDIIEGVTDVAGKFVPVAGGYAGDDTKLQGTHQFANGKVYKEALIALAGIFNVETSHSFLHNLVPYDEGAIVTKSSDYIVNEVNNKAACEELERLTGRKISRIPPKPLLKIGKYAAKLGALDTVGMMKNSSLMPFGVSDVTGTFWIRLTKSVGPKNSVEFLNKIPELVVLRKMKLDEKEMEKVDRETIEYFNKTLSEPAFMMIMECATRKILLGQKRFEEMFEKDKKLFSSTPMIGFFTYGEYGVSPKSLNGQFMLTNVGFGVGDKLISDVK